MLVSAKTFEAASMDWLQDDELDFDPGDESDHETGGMLDMFDEQEPPPEEMEYFAPDFPAPSSPSQEKLLPVIESPQSMATTASCGSPAVGQASSSTETSPYVQMQDDELEEAPDLPDFESRYPLISVNDIPQAVPGRGPVASAHLGHGVPVGSAVAGSQLRRLRIRGKTKPSERTNQGLPLQMQKHDKDLALARLKQETRFVSIRDFYVDCHREGVRGRYAGLTSGQVLKKTREAYYALSENDRVSWCIRELWLRFGGNSAFQSRAGEHSRAQAERAEEAEIIRLTETFGNARKFMGALATWNGDWLDHEPEWMDLMKQNLEGDEFSEAVRHTMCFRTLVASFQEFLEQRTHKLSFKHWSYAFEHSTKSEKPGRIHIHAFWHADRHRWHAGAPEAWAFKGCVPHVKKLKPEELVFGQRSTGAISIASSRRSGSCSPVGITLSISTSRCSRDGSLHCGSKENSRTRPPARRSSQREATPQPM